MEVDPETGTVRLVRYLMVQDCGRRLNPLLVDGQLQGGVAQGIGQALLEHTAFDADGQLVSGSLMDYCLPRADDLPAFEGQDAATPAPGNPLGVKGIGEAGAVAAPPAVVNAVLDALADAGVRELDMPLTPERVWRALRAARSAA